MGEPRTGSARLSSPEAAAAGWQRLHHGIDPRGNRLLWGWLRVIWSLARPCARVHVPPLAITVLGAALAVWAALTRAAWLGFALILLAVVCDGLDGAVAMLSGRASRAGARVDKIADRIADVCFVVVIWWCGASAPLAAVAALAMLGVEGVREVRGGAALARITVAERPSRTVCALLACAGAAVTSAAWPANVCAGVLLGLSLIGVWQLVSPAAGGRAS